MGMWELMLVLAIVVLLFGGSRLPELGKGLGLGLRSFRDAIKGEEEKQLKGQGGEEGKKDDDLKNS